MAKPRKSTVPFEFNPQSLDAQLAKIIERMDSHHKEHCTRFDGLSSELVFVKEQTTRTNGRVTALELWKETSVAKRAGIAMAFGTIGSGIAWAIGVLIR